MNNNKLKTMKTTYLISVSLLVALFFNSCDFLEYSERSFAEKDDVFTAYNRTTAFLISAYSSLPSGFSDVGDAMLESATDNAAYAWDDTNIQNFYNGIWSPINNIDAQWSAMYTGIRRANMFLDNADDAVLEEHKWRGDAYQTMLKKWAFYRYEARFLRAFYHFELAKRYGDIPLVDIVMTLDEANNITRRPFKDVVEWIARECSDIAPHLPESYRDNTITPDVETGRITRGAALALKSRALLYLASPLHNPETASDFNERWENAAKAAYELISSDIYSNTLPTWENVFNRWRAENTELILERRLENSRDFEIANTSIGFTNGRSGNCPTQNLVDAFEMLSTGKSIFDANGNYVPEYDPDNPYEDRDPRLRMTVLYHGATWGMGERQIMDMSFNGADGPPQVGASPTGYYLRKYMRENTIIAPPNMNETEHCWILFRYTEVLLNFAEAMNEAYGPAGDNNGEYTLTALDAVNFVRNRPEVRMLPFPNDITKEEFREKIRNERRVELAFEGHRMWDLRRWRQGDMTRQIRGISITQQDGVTTFEPVTIQNRLWDDKMYFYPIPQAEIYNTNGMLEQNNGWD